MRRFIQPFFGARINEKSQKRVHYWLSGGLLCIFLGACGDAALVEQYCTLGYECENDLLVGNSEDSIQVCRIHIETMHRRLDANSESICADIKTAHLDYMRCVLKTADTSSEADQCDGLNLIFSPCHGERATWSNLVADSGNDCNE